MTSQRNSILDAAATQVEAVGLRRTTLTDVARRAGVSRMTVYRQYADAATLFRALLTTVIAEVVTTAERAASAEADGRHRLVRAATEGVSGLVTHPLLRRVLEVDPELVLPLIVDRLGSGQRLVRARLEAYLREGIADGSVRPLDPAIAAHVLLVAVQSFVFSVRLTETESDPGAVEREVAALVSRYLEAS